MNLSKVNRPVILKVGQTFGRWTVVSATPTSIRGLMRWSCVCSCGTTRLVRGSLLRDGGSRSCGCLTRKYGSPVYKSLEYRAWVNARLRCCNKDNAAYASYGGRGITMAPEWKDDYLRFLADMGPCPTGHSLDRHPDNDGNYEPGNVRWATDEEQARNRRSNVWLTFNGETRCLIEWAERLGVSCSVISRRLRTGWSVERALTEPVKVPAR